MNLRNQIRHLLKTTIKLFDKLTRNLPGAEYDVLILADFDGNQVKLIEELSEFKIKHLRFKISKSALAAYYIRRSKVVYVDNFNIVIAALDNIEAKIIQYWHATSAVKKFGLPTVTDQAELTERKSELVKYDYIVANSDYMAEKLKLGFGTSDDRILNIGCLQSKKLFNSDDIKPIFDYIVYVPTFRWDRKHDKQAIEFIKNFKSDKYKLIYSLHPKIEREINNEDAINAVGTDIRRYFQHAKLVISDYSSLLVDASLKCNAVAMYAYDIADYKKNPGLYINQENFWGYYTESAEQLIEYINQPVYQQHDLAYIKQRFFTNDDQDSIKRIAQVGRDILNEKTPE